MTQPAIHRRLSTPTLGLIWFGASVSLAEILTGHLFSFIAEGGLGFEGEFLCADQRGSVDVVAGIVNRR